MAEIDDVAILARAKKNCARNGLCWEAGDLQSGAGAAPKTGAAISEETRKAYLAGAYRQLLSEAAKNA